MLILFHSQLAINILYARITIEREIEIDNLELENETKEKKNAILN